MIRLAFITPWYGEKIPGGMEMVTRHTVKHLIAQGYEVEVWTTCIRDFFDEWSHNHHRAGLTQEGGVPVRRFKVAKRNKPAFDAVNAELMNGRLPSTTDQQTYLNEMINCPDLFAHIKQNPDYLLFFLPYMFSTTISGAQIAPQRSAVIPCLHDEAYARLPIYGQVLSQVHTLVFLAHAEGDLTQQFYGKHPEQYQHVVGSGVDVDITAVADRFRQTYNLHQPFILYVGRRSAGKNAPLLVDYWTRYAQATGTSAQLVLMGPDPIHLTAEQKLHVRDVGFVPLQDKYDGMAAASALCQPSLNESFSLVMMESWLTETPTLVHGHCAVTKEHCVRSNGGLYFTNYPEFVGTIEYLLTHEKERQMMGQNGRSYVLQHFKWAHIMQQYQQIITQMAKDNGLD